MQKLLEKVISWSPPPVWNLVLFIILALMVITGIAPMETMLLTVGAVVMGGFIVVFLIFVWLLLS